MHEIDTLTGESLRQISGVDALEVDDFGDSQLIVVDSFLPCWKNLLSESTLTDSDATHGEKIERLILSTSFPPENLKTIDLASKSDWPKNSLEINIFLSRCFLDVLTEIYNQRSRLGRVISLSVNLLMVDHQLLNNIFTSELMKTQKHIAQSDKLSVWGRDVDLDEFKQLYFTTEIQIVKLVEQLRAEGFVFVCATPNFSESFSVTHILSQAITVSGVIIESQNSDITTPNSLLSLETLQQTSSTSVSAITRELNTHPNANDVRFISRWDVNQDLLYLEGNSFATPIVAEGVVMIQHYFPELFEVEPQITDKQVKNDLANLREHVIRALFSASSPKRKIEGRSLAVLDLGELKKIILTKKPAIAQQITLMKQQVCSRDSALDLEISSLKNVLPYQKEDNSIGSENYPLTVHRGENIYSLVHKILPYLKFRKHSLGVFFTFGNETYFINHDYVITAQGSTSFYLMKIQEAMSKVLANKTNS